jgi:hypothetical protein
MASATKKAICIIVTYAVIQLALLFYSISHPSIDDLVTDSFLFVIIIYPAVFRYHAHKMKTFVPRSSELPQNSG